VITTIISINETPDRPIAMAFATIMFSPRFPRQPDFFREGLFPERHGPVDDFRDTDLQDIAPSRCRRCTAVSSRNPDGSFRKALFDLIGITIRAPLSRDEPMQTVSVVQPDPRRDFAIGSTL
jgi:hypothetical protein